MRALRIAVILALMAAMPLLMAAQNAGTAPNQGAGNGAAAAQSALRILSPAPGEVLKQNFVVVKYELTNPGIAGGAPNFRIQLDSRDPVVTTFNEHTFTGLTPGEHILTIELVDANNTPVAGARYEIKFNTAQPKTMIAPGHAVAQSGGTLKPASLQVKVDDLPSASSALPLLSVIGFGALLGGIASALRTR